MASIIVIEGLVCAGKTTLLNNLERSTGCLIIPEYKDCLEDSEEFPHFPPSSREEALLSSEFFVRLERHRQKHLAKLLRKDGLIIFDRSILSCLAFDYAARDFTGFDTYPEVVQIYQAENFYQPHLCLYLDIPYKTVIDRMKQRGTFSGDQFANEKFNKLLVGFYQHFLSLPHFIKIDAKLSEQEVLNQALTIIKNDGINKNPVKILEIAQKIA